MRGPTVAESRLYAELTKLLMSMKDMPLEQVEAAIEDRFRAFVREREPQGGTLTVTLSWTLPEGCDGWAAYGTEYNVTAAVRPAGESAAAIRRQEGVSADVIPFPRRRVAG